MNTHLLYCCYLGENSC